MIDLGALGGLADDPNGFAALVFGGGMLAISLFTLLWLALLPGSERQLARRIERIQSPAAARSGEVKANVGGGTVRRQTRDSSIASLDKLFKRMLPDGNQLRLRLERSGLKVRVGDYLLGCLGLGLLTLIAMWLFAGSPMLANASVAVLAGVGLPHLVLGHLTRRRVKQFTSLLPEALDLIVRGIRSARSSARSPTRSGSGSIWTRRCGALRGGCRSPSSTFW
jgi:tight adherence protein B